MTDWQAIARQISDTTGVLVEPGELHPLGGGCINTTVRLGSNRQSYFVKINRACQLPMFEAEGAGLTELASSRTIRVPKPVCVGTSGEHAYLAMEYIPLTGSGDNTSAGRQLAALHNTLRGRFGWDRDNTIGSTPQPNRWSDDWIRFWREHRLGFQLQLAASNGYGGALQRRGELLLERFPALIDHNPRPSLIHGDLWGGNMAWDEAGSPVIYDPAVYYGDREAELAMTELFGGFGGRFYSAYNEAWPLDPGYGSRKVLYNLYHILNHLNIFGGGYGSQALGMIDRLLAEL